MQFQIHLGENILKFFAGLSFVCYRRNISRAEQQSVIKVEFWNVLSIHNAKRKPYQKNNTVTETSQ